MTYIDDRGGTIQTKALEIAEFTVSGNPTTNQYFTLTLEDDTFGSSPSVTTDTITLSAGHYKCSCFFAVSKPGNGAKNYKYQLELDGSLTGFVGQTKSYLNTNIDSSDAVFSILSGTKPLKLKLLAIEVSAPTILTGECKLWIWRSDL